ncbi:MAG: hypothetical protein ACTTJ1_05805 [Treponema sp.]
MKQKKIVSIIGALILLISAVAVITGCSQVNDVKSADKSVGIIEFDSASINCKNRNSSPYTDVTSGSQIHKDDALLFEAILPAGKIVENWYVNDVKQEYKTDSIMTYTVKASDFADGKLKIGVVFIVPKIEFDSAVIKCQNTNSYPYTDVASGSQIHKDDALLFEAILPAGKIVENWYVNDVKQEYKTDSIMTYTVKASDIAGGKIKIGVVFKVPEKGTVEFDSAAIKCQNTNSFPYTDVTSGSPIQEKDELRFEAILPTGKIVENWYINDVKQEYKTNSTMIYTVKASDIAAGKLKISVVFKVPEKGTVEFDSAAIKCQNTNSFPYTDVTSGSPIQEKDELRFEAILPTGKIVENWYINDVKQKYNTDSTMYYTVKASDIVGGKLKIGVVFK